MKITVRYFAQLKEKMARDHDLLTLPESASVSQLFEKIFTNTEECERYKNYLRVAVHEEYASLDTQLHDGDEVVFIPPVAGG